MLTDVHHGLRQRNGILQRFHERAVPRFYIQQDAVRAGSQLFTHDAAGDERNTGNRSRYIPQRIHLFVRRSQVARLPDDRDAYVVHLPEKRFLRERHRASGDSLDLIQRAARMPQAAAAHLRNLYAARGHDRPRHQGGLVAHAPRGMFVSLDAADPRKVHHIAAVSHGCRKLGGLRCRHAAQVNSHHQRTHLVIRDAARGKAVYRERDLLLRQRTAVPLFGDDIIHAHKKISFIRFVCAPGSRRARCFSRNAKGRTAARRTARRRQPAPDSFSFRAAF